MFSDFSYELRNLLNDSKKQMKCLGHSYIGTEHFLLSVLKSKNDIRVILNDNGITYDIFKNKIIEKIGYGKSKENVFVFTPLFKKILEESILISADNRNKTIDSSNIFQLILDEGEGVAYRIMCELGLDIDKLYDSINVEPKAQSKKLITDMGIDITERAKDGLVDPVIGREKEIDNVIEILLRKNKRNPLLIGPAGVGKTAVVEGLATRIINGSVPKKLLNKKIISLSMASLVAGTKYRGEFEEKLLGIIKELEDDNRYIIFIDEIHTIMGAGGAEGAIDASNILKPALSRDKITIIGATTTDEYKKYIEVDKAISRRLQNVIINEPTEKELNQILKKIVPTYEKYHNVKLSDNIVKYLIKMAKKYFKNRKEPDRSIDILDEVSSMISSGPDKNEIVNTRLKNKLNRIKNIKNKLISNSKYEEALECRIEERKIETKINRNELNKNKKNTTRIITKDDINKLISKKYNISLYNSKIAKSVFESQKKEFVSKHVNYIKEINELFDCLKNLFICERIIKKPMSILFLGSDKSIKDELTVNITKRLFNNNLIKIDLSEYSDEQSIGKIMGSFLGYNNKQSIFEQLKIQPFQLIEINNYEKANIRIKEIINKILEDGYFIDSYGCRIDFLNALIIINDELVISPIGFNNNCCNYKMPNIKTIIFNKSKATMI